jgi:hypothetical protein
MNQGSAQRPKRRPTEFARTERRRRIFARLGEGWAYDDIAREEKLTPRRVRQIVADYLDSRGADDGSRHVLVQLARLEPALKAAGEAVAQGDVRAIAPLMKVLDRLDRYQKSAERTKPAASGEGDKLVISELKRRFREQFEEELRQEQAARQAAEAQLRGYAVSSGGETPAQDPPDAPSPTPAQDAPQTTDGMESMAENHPPDGPALEGQGRRPVAVRMILNGVAAG